MTRQVIYGFIVRNFNADIRNTDANKWHNYNAKLSGNTVAQQASNAANVILENVTSDVPLEYLSNIWRSLKAPLINCKVVLTLEWTKHCVFYLCLAMKMIMLKPVV